ncbi:MAG: response regulator transcription factor [Verrucomicrobia bacterium]|nr:response regulator transcription factor [Verrucomicrobiota bacterium]
MKNKILIIEDETSIRENLHDDLEMEGFSVLSTDNGAEGVETAQEEMPDLVLCDVMMPGMDGHAVLAALRGHKATARIPFIFLTAKGELEDLRAGMNLGADDYLIKPVKVHDLLAAIRTRLERMQEHRTTVMPDFTSHEPLQSLGLTPREAEVLFWAAQGKTNPEIAMIVSVTRATVKKHLENVYQKLGAENRAMASLRAMEVLSAQSS